MKLMNKIREKKNETRYWDYYFMFEDDAILLPSFTSSLVQVLNAYPDFWTLVAFDTFNRPKDLPIPINDYIMSELPLYSISGTTGTYWGAHAWLLASEYVERFIQFYKNSPTMPLDWVPK